MKMLTMIGCSHLDVDGYDRLKKLLDHLKPTVIGVEDTERDWNGASHLFRTGSPNYEQAVMNGGVYFPNADRRTLRLWFSSLGYIGLAIDEYSVTNSIPLIFCDDPEILIKVDFERSASNPASAVNQGLEGFLRLSPMDARADIAKEYATEEYPVRDSAPLVEFYQSRDRFTERKLRAAESNLVYVCGLDHIFGDYHPNLFDRLSDLGPARIKLSEADKL
jgi:hypothetical protein